MNTEGEDGQDPISGSRSSHSNGMSYKQQLNSSLSKTVITKTWPKH